MGVDFKNQRWSELSAFQNELYTILEYEDIVIDNKTTIKQGDIVIAKRDDGYEQQSIYYGEINGKYAVDFNGTHVMLFDRVEKLKTYTKKEAKQKVSELYSNQNIVQPHEIIEIIDRIEG